MSNNKTLRNLLENIQFSCEMIINRAMYYANPSHSNCEDWDDVCSTAELIKSEVSEFLSKGLEHER